MSVISGLSDMSGKDWKPDMTVGASILYFVVKPDSVVILSVRRSACHIHKSSYYISLYNVPISPSVVFFQS